MVKRVLLILSFCLGVLFLFMSIGCFITPITDYNEITTEYFTSYDTSSGIVFIVLAFLFLLVPIKNFIFFIIEICKSSKEDKESKIYEEELRGIRKITKGVSVIEKEKKIILNSNEYFFKDILNAELIEDGNSITTTTGKKKASVGKALVGGALLGSAGAIIGGTSGRINSKSVETQYCTNLKVKISINQLSNPCEFIKLIEYRTDRESNKYKLAFEDAQKILSVIEIICSQNK